MIIGERVRLRSAERADIPLFVTWLDDPEVTRNLATYLPMSTAREEAWFENMVNGPAEQHVLVIEIAEAESWKPVGCCGFNRIDHRAGNSEVGIFIGEKSYWNRGYGTDAMKLLLVHGFRTLNLHRIYLRVYADNLGGIRAYEKAGYVHEGCQRQAAYVEGKYIDVLMMSVLRPEWEQAYTAKE